MKKEEEELKAHMRREAQARRVRERAHARGLSHNYLDEAYDEEDGVSVQAIKNRMKSCEWHKCDEDLFRDLFNSCTPA